VDRKIIEALISQQLAALAMLRDCIERCPADVWISGRHPRTFWRIAYHALYFGHLYLHGDLDGFRPWEKHVDSATDLWGTPPPNAEQAKAYIEPPVIEPYSQEDVLSYLDAVALQAAGLIQRADISAEECGIPWYPNFPKLDHLIMNIRHMQGHVGQLSEILMAADSEFEPAWIGRRSDGH
jgi:hypothetical protein